MDEVCFTVSMVAREGSFQGGEEAKAGADVGEDSAKVGWSAEGFFKKNCGYWGPMGGCCFFLVSLESLCSMQSGDMSQVSIAFFSCF